MTLTTHAVVGAAVASFFPEQPYLAFAAGFMSHLAIDALPHYDYGEFLHSFEKDPHHRLQTDMRFGKHFLHDLRLIGADALLGFLLAFVVARILGISYEYALIGAGAGVYPDLIQFVYYKLRKTWLEVGLAPLQRFHVWIQDGVERPEWGWRKGFGLQALLAVGILIAVLLVR